MTTNEINAPGTFCWMELQTSDRAGAIAFYGSLFGWGTTDVPVGDGLVYSMIDLGGKSIGGMWQMGDDTPAGTRPAWRLHIAATDVDESVAHARTLGADVLMEPHDVMDIGRMAVLRDPTGAVIALWEARGFGGFEVVMAPGSLTWAELATHDMAAARDFYSALVGWGSEDLPGPTAYAVFTTEGSTPVAGVMGMDDGFPPDALPAWVPYLAVLDVDDILARAGSIGGRTLMGPMDTPYGRLAVLADPQGAVLSIIRPDRDPVPAPGG